MKLDKTHYFRIFLSTILVLCMSLSFLPSFAFANNPQDTLSQHPLLNSPNNAPAASDNSNDIEKDANSTAPKDNNASNADSEDTETSDDSNANYALYSLPAYSLTNSNEVTPAKLQSPWGACWAFAVASAIESSILKAQTKIQAEAQEGTQTENSTDTQGAFQEQPKLSGLLETIDLSERAIAWLTHELQTKDSAGTQAGEGFTLLETDNPLAQLSAGNFAIAESLLAARQGLIFESAVPYAYNEYPNGPEWFDMGTYPGASDDARTYDWSVDDNVRTLDETGWRVNEILELACPSRQNTDWSTGTTQYEGYDSYATDAIKRTLVDTGAVAIALEMDESLPREIAQGDFENAEPSGGFTYSTWCQYDAAETVAPNHAVTIVGWDDTIPASAFQGTESGNPPGNGAWLCKNNWGSDELYASLDASNSANHWGLRDEQGLASGFFWLSYYDHTITTPVAFKVTPTAETIENIYQYDFLSTSEFASPACYETTVKTANAFVANDIELLEAVTAWTFSPNETVTTEIYVLPVSKSASDTIDLTNGDEVFEEATLLQTTSQTFNTAGFHTINLDAPVFLAKGQRFLIAQQIKGISTDDQGGEHDVNYLGLELAYSNPQSFYDQPTIASVVSNPGETYVMLLRNGWDTLEEHNAWYADLRDQQGKTVDIVYGNALSKALTSPTTMAGDAQVYETVPLEKTNNS